MKKKVLTFLCWLVVLASASSNNNNNNNNNQEEEAVKGRRLRESALVPVDDETTLRKTRHGRPGRRGPLLHDTSLLKTRHGRPPRSPSISSYPSLTPSLEPSSFVFCPDQSPLQLLLELSLPFLGRPNSLTPNETMALEEGFALVYNSIVEPCDGASFRSVNAVQIVPIQDPTLLIITQPFVLRHRITLSCRGCSSTNSTLFTVLNTANTTNDTVASIMTEGVRLLESNQDNDDVSRFFNDNYKQQQQQQQQDTEDAEYGFYYDRHLQAESSVVPSSVPSSAVPSSVPSSAPVERVALEPCPLCEGPLVDYFIGNLSLYVDELVANGTLTSIELLGTNPVELEEVNCEEEFTDLFSDVFVDFVVNQEAALKGELVSLEEAFRASYNSLNSFNPETCDIFFRQIVDVQLLSTDVNFNRRRRQRRDLQLLIPPNNNNNMTNATLPPALSLRPFAFLFRVRGRCRGCVRNANLFDEGSRRRVLFPDGGLDSRHLQQDSNVPDECVCNLQPEEFRAPTREEFTIVYNDTVTTLVEEGEVTFIQEVVEVAEVEQVGCPVDVSSFTTQLFVGLTGSPGALDAAQEMILADTFVTTYNNQVEEFCDPLFRTVESVTVVELLDPSGMPADRTNPSPAINVPYTAVFQATGRCRGCPPNSNLFDDGSFGRRLSLQDGLDERSSLPRRMEQGEVCYCDTTFTAERTPSEEEFLVRFTDSVFALNLTGVARLVEIAEPNPTNAPSQSPSTGAPSELNQDRFNSIVGFPFSIDTTVFGGTSSTGSSFPLYFLNERPTAPGGYTGQRDDGESFTLTVTEIVLTWSQLQQLGNITTGNGETDLVNGVLSGPSSSVALSALIVTASGVIQVLPFSDPSNVPVFRQRLLSQLQTSSSNSIVTQPALPELINSPRIYEMADRRLQNECPDFVVDAFNNATCLDSELIETDTECVLLAETKYSVGISLIEQNRTDLADTTDALERSITTTKIISIAVGVVGCIISGFTDSSFDIGACVLSVYTAAARAETNARDQLDDFVASELARIGAEEIALCEQVSTDVKLCFTCQGCSLDTPDVECCADSDCDTLDAFCSASTCFNDGTLRFTLEWSGDDDLNLHVVTPNGVEISPSNPVDSTSGGQWESSISNNAFGVSAENIYFSQTPLARQVVSVPSGTYTYFVVATQGGAMLDSWTLTVFANGVEAASTTSIGSSGRLQVVFDAPTGTPSIMPSAKPSVITAIPSFVPSALTGFPSETPTTALPSLQPSPEPTTLAPTTSQPSDVPTGMPSVDPSSAPSSMPSEMPSLLPSVSPSALPSLEPSAAPSSIPSGSPSSIPSDIPSDKPSSEPSDIPSLIPSDAPSDKPSSKPSDIPSFAPSDIPSDIPSAVPSSSPAPSISPSSEPSATPSESPSSVPTSTRPPSLGPSTSVAPSAEPSLSPSSVPSSSPSTTPSSEPSTIPSSSPSAGPSAVPSDIPSGTPSAEPSLSPSSIPSSIPSGTPSAEPSQSPSSFPSSIPSGTPSAEPSLSPSFVPSAIPSAMPSQEPSLSPSSGPSAIPSRMPSAEPSLSPSSSPSDIPSKMPAAEPSEVPSLTPSSSPSDVPSSGPSFLPSQSIEPSLSNAPSMCVAGMNGAECCTDEDCTGGSCSSQTCTAFPALVFSLFWTGDDDLDIEVTPPVGNKISFRRFSDPTSGGELDQDVIPTMVSDNNENVSFQTNPPSGTYQVQVIEFDVVGVGSDSWTLKGYQSGTQFFETTGTGTSLLLPVVFPSAS